MNKFREGKGSISNTLTIKLFFTLISKNENTGKK